MEQKVLQRKVNYIAPTLNTETESETAYRQIRVAAYCRVSTQMEEQLNSYEVQVKHYTDKINSEPKWSFAGIYADKGISGTSAKKRDEFMKMIRACKRHKIDMIITKSISRFSRNTLDCLKYIRILKELNVDVFFEEQGLHSKDAGAEFYITIYGSIAQSEAENISANVRWSKQQSAKEGKVAFSYNSFLGYKKGADGKPEIFEDEAKIIREIYDKYLEGDSILKIADYLNDNRIKTPTSGKCIINGKNPTENRKSYVKGIGVVFGQRTQLWWDLPLRETYGVLKEIYEVPYDKYKERMAFLNEVLDLESFITSPVRTLSLGQRMRADIAASLLHSPKVLFLDEPTIGLDVVVKDNIRRAIEYINIQEKTTVILTTHDLSDIELLANRIVMIDKGRNVFDGSISELKSKYGQIRELHFDTDSKNAESRLNYSEYFGFNEDDLSVEREGNTFRVRFNSTKAPVSDMLSYTLNRVNVKDISVKDADIEEIIRRLYKQGV